MEQAIKQEIITHEYFKEELEDLTQWGIKTFDVGIVAADLQNIAADMLKQSDDEEFKELAVENFRERVLDKHTKAR